MSIGRYQKCANVVTCCIIDIGDDIRYSMQNVVVYHVDIKLNAYGFSCVLVLLFWHVVCEFIYATHLSTLK